MRTFMRHLFTAILTLSCLSAAVALAGDPPGSASAGKTKTGPCVACHGADGFSNTGLFPNLAGQKEEYLRHALHQYRKAARGEESERTAKMMCGASASLSDPDIADLAAYYASLPATPPAETDPAP